jgi:hypothetical protein
MTKPRGSMGRCIGLLTIMSMIACVISCADDSMEINAHTPVGRQSLSRPRSPRDRTMSRLCGVRGALRPAPRFAVHRKAGCSSKERRPRLTYEALPGIGQAFAAFVVCGGAEASDATFVQKSSDRRAAFAREMRRRDAASCASNHILRTNGLLGRNGGAGLSISSPRAFSLPSSGGMRQQPVSPASPSTMRT